MKEDYAPAGRPTDPILMERAFDGDLDKVILRRSELMNA